MGCDAVVVLGCGGAVQTARQATEEYGLVKRVVSGLDSVGHMDTIVPDALWIERCLECGECVLNETGGICPMTLCAKSLMNGPCGGAKDGKCEVSPDRDCAWHLIYERLKALGNSKLIGTDTGFRNLNDKTSGFGKGDLVIIAARPAMGKTALVLNMALKAIERNEGVAFFSLEMPAEQLMLRMLSAKTSIPLQALRIGDLKDEQWSQFSAAVDDIAQKKLFVDDGGYATIHHVRSKLRKLKSQHPEITVAIIDYLQLMSGEGGREGRQQEISEISRGLKQLARELDMPIVALSQLNRSLESRDNKRPMLSDLRESGAIEQDADIILFVYRDDVYREAQEKEKEMRAKAEGKEYQSNFRKKSEEEAEIIIGKQRNGPTGTVDLIFQKNFTRFVDASPTAAFEVIYEEGNIDMREGNIELPPI